MTEKKIHLVWYLLSMGGASNGPPLISLALNDPMYVIHGSRSKAISCMYYIWNFMEDCIWYVYLKFFIRHNKTELLNKNIT